MISSRPGEEVEAQRLAQAERATEEHHLVDVARPDQQRFVVAGDLARVEQRHQCAQQQVMVALVAAQQRQVADVPHPEAVRLAARIFAIDVEETLDVGLRLQRDELVRQIRDHLAHVSGDVGARRCAERLVAEQPAKRAGQRIAARRSAQPAQGIEDFAARCSVATFVAAVAAADDADDVVEIVVVVEPRREPALDHARHDRHRRGLRLAPLDFLQQTAVRFVAPARRGDARLALAALVRGIAFERPGERAAVLPDQRGVVALLAGGVHPMHGGACRLEQSDAAEGRLDLLAAHVFLPMRSQLSAVPRFTSRFTTMPSTSSMCLVAARGPAGSRAHCRG